MVTGNLRRTNYTTRFYCAVINSLLIIIFSVVALLARAICANGVSLESRFLLQTCSQETTACIPTRAYNIGRSRQFLTLRKLCASFCMSVEKYRCNVDKKRPTKYRRYRDRYFYTKVSSISISIHQKYRR